MTGDPLYLDGVDLTDIGIMVIKVLVAFTFLLVATMFMVWFERKLISVPTSPAPGACCRLLLMV